MGNAQPYNAQPYSRDRTQEFQSIAETLKNSLFEFNKRVSKISLGIHQTSQKLAKLAELSNRRSVFDDPTREMEELSEVIKQGITALNSDVLDLQRLCNAQKECWNVSTAASRNYTEVIDNLKNRLMNLAGDFTDLTMRTEKLKADETRRQLYRPHASTELTNPFVRQSPLATKSAASESPAPPPRVNGASSSSTQFPSKQGDGESQALLQQQRQEQQQMVPQQDTYMQSRAKALKEIDSTIRELTNIFNQLGFRVPQQEKKGMRIDEMIEENIETTLTNDGAQNQLVKYLNSISSNGWLAIKIFFFVLIVFLMIFLIFVK